MKGDACNRSDTRLYALRVTRYIQGTLNFGEMLDSLTADTTLFTLDFVFLPRPRHILEISTCRVSSVDPPCPFEFQFTIESSDDSATTYSTLLAVPSTSFMSYGLSSSAPAPTPLSPALQIPPGTRGIDLHPAKDRVCEHPWYGLHA